MHKCMAGKLGIFTSIRSSSYLISALSSTICEETSYYSILLKFTIYLKLTAGFSAVYYNLLVGTITVGILISCHILLLQYYLQSYSAREQR